MIQETATLSNLGIDCDENSSFDESTEEKTVEGEPYACLHKAILSNSACI